MEKLIINKDSEMVKDCGSYYEIESINFGGDVDMCLDKILDCKGDLDCKGNLDCIKIV